MSGGDLRPSSPRRLDLRSASDAHDTKTRLRRDTKSHGIRSWKSIFREACAKRGGRGALFASSVSLKKGGVERKLSLGLVRSFFALSIGDNILSFSLPCLGGYHWLRTRRLLRLQKANSSLAPLPLRFAAFSRRSTGRGRARCPTAPRRRGDTPPYLMMGLADVTRRMCPNVTCHSLPVCRAADILFSLS